MSKTKHRHNKDDNYGNDEIAEVKRPNRIKQKRFDRALKTLDIDELMGIDDEGIDPEDYFYTQEFEDDYK